MLLDAESVVGAYLRDHADVAALRARVVPGTPPNTDAPWVRVTLIDPRNVTGSTEHEYLVDYQLQFDCYSGRSGDQALASRLVRTVRAALVAMRGGHGDVVVSAVAFAGMHRLPDRDFEPEMQRYILTADIRMHPAG